MQEKFIQIQIYYNLSLTRFSTTAGSASVDVSPSSSTCPQAIFRRILLMILPLLVLGRPGANWSLSGVAIGPMTVLTCPIKYLLQFICRLLPIL